MESGIKNREKKWLLAEKTWHLWAMAVEQKVMNILDNTKERSEFKVYEVNTL